MDKASEMSRMVAADVPDWGRMYYLIGKQGVHIRFRPDNENGARAKAGYGNDRFVHLPTDVLGLLDVYITEIWIEATPYTDYLWIMLKKEAKSREGRSTYGAALNVAAVEKVFQHYSMEVNHLRASYVILSILFLKYPSGDKKVNHRI